jgi:hypothetical protein
MNLVQSVPGEACGYGVDMDISASDKLLSSIATLKLPYGSRTARQDGAGCSVK